MQRINLNIRRSRVIHADLESAALLSQSVEYCDEYVNILHLVYPTGIELLWWYDGENAIPKPWRIMVSRRPPESASPPLLNLSCETFPEALLGIEQAIEIASSSPSTAMRVFSEGEIEGHWFSEKDVNLVLNFCEMDLSKQIGIDKMSFVAEGRASSIVIVWNKEANAFRVTNAMPQAELIALAFSADQLREIVFSFAVGRLGKMNV